MKEQKNIERLFQEKFKDFEATPPQGSWDMIASRLNEKKKKKRVIPFWFQLSGIAASLIIVGTLILNYQSEQDNLIQDNTNTIVSEDAKNKTNNDNNISNTGIKNSRITSSESNELNQKTSEKNKFEENINQNKINTNSITKTKNVIVSGSKENKKSNSTISSFTNSNGNIVDNTKGNNISKNKKRNTAKNNNITIPNDELIGNENVFVNSNDKSLVIDQKKKSIDQTNNKNINSDKIDAFFEKDKKETIVTNNTNDDLKENNNSTTIVASTQIITKDSTLVAKIAEEKNPLEELLAAKEEGRNEDEKEKEKRSKWAVSTNASPVYFNSLAEGSSIDSRLIANQKSFNSTLSYGVGINYNITKKLTVKTGINSLKIDYNTNDITFYQDIGAKPLENIKTNNAGKMINIESKLQDNGQFVSVIGTPLVKYDGSLNQEIGFIEVPLELSYKLIDKKFGIDVIGGVSTLFLSENNVSLVSNGQEMSIGSANNLNNIHFSSNVGLGFKYSFWKNFNANFQPMFKYQINTFSENSGNFKPYFIGLYSGISFSF
ncbi:hypothetical protein M9Q43_01700 [Flavobacterium sp. HXWNR29]|uniref:hypothetical protein n=1 Tax=Flavobacterium odoriferum TaxID=2946604 RepID=UPI0021CB8EDC|nr:hypothetical protein [Flavobacterium sp. HXWNR29]MCU4187874.1 hypothetical protein [Flavobacterium sp. HXWNR29]